MHTLVSPPVFTSGLSLLFAATAAVHLFGWRALRETYTRWGYPRGFREVTGSLLLAAAVFLYFPSVRIFGLIIAALVMFLSATTLLHHRQYGFAAPVIALLFALIPVTLGASV